ncbi:MAG: AAA family ATPase [Deltaproteobacteria bacterium]|nr:AAA family ATPase [Deltaproteobacteria bacterium]
MYTTFYGLKEKPFEISPDPKFLYLSPGHQEALAHMVYAVSQRIGFTVITGEVGTGKTTLVQSLLSQLNGSTRTAYLFNPNLSILDFLEYICEDLGVKTNRRSKGQYIAHLYQALLDYYARNVGVVLIIDEAHRLKPELLEEIRLLTNLETPKGKLLQVILVGQPELNETLDRKEFRQLKQRISLRYHLRMLTRKEAFEYIENRLRKAGLKGPPIFSAKALELIFEYSRGTPRLINIVCDNALIAGYASDRQIIEKNTIQEVIDNREGLGGQRRLARGKIVLIILLVLFFLLILGWYWWR